MRYSLSLVLLFVAVMSRAESYQEEPKPKPVAEDEDAREAPPRSATAPNPAPAASADEFAGLTEEDLQKAKAALHEQVVAASKRIEKKASGRELDERLEDLKRLRGRIKRLDAALARARAERLVAEADALRKILEAMLTSETASARFWSPAPPYKEGRARLLSCGGGQASLDPSRDWEPLVKKLRFEDAWSNGLTTKLSGGRLDVRSVDCAPAYSFVKHAAKVLQKAAEDAAGVPGAESATAHVRWAETTYFVYRAEHTYLGNPPAAEPILGPNVSRDRLLPP